jgi:hypothetical protein
VLEGTGLPAADWHALSVDALERAAAGDLRATIGQVFPLDRAADAHAGIEARSTIGKTLLHILAQNSRSSASSLSGAREPLGQAKFREPTLAGSRPRLTDAGFARAALARYAIKAGRAGAPEGEAQRARRSECR